MKKYVIQLAILLSLIVGNPVWASQTVTVFVKGMVCDFCVRGLTKGFNAYKEKSTLDDFKVDLSKHTITLNVKEGAAISDSEITKVVQDSSMAVDKIVR